VLVRPSPHRTWQPATRLIGPFKLDKLHPRILLQEPFDNFFALLHEHAASTVKEASSRLEQLNAGFRDGLLQINYLL